MTEQQITLENWRQATFAEHCRPHRNTVRRWAKDNLLDPPATKCGREYYVSPATRYTDGRTTRATTKPRLIDRIRAAETAQP